jgi:hypothetical protein
VAVDDSLDLAAARLAALLTGGATGLADPSASEIDWEFEAEPVARPLPRLAPPADVWAVDGGQCLVADARCVQLLVTRAARARFVDGECVLEDEGELEATVLGQAADRVAALHRLAFDGIDAGTSVDVNLLRDAGEWRAVERAVEEAEPGALVLVDGDLQPDWRIPSSFLAALLTRAAERDVLLAGITKHSSLARGGAPLLGWLEREAELLLGLRSMWWAPIARTRGDVGGVQVVAARLDPDARFSFRVDLPLGVDPEVALGRIAAVSDDAAFPGYPYPLSVADRLAACPGWLRDELWHRLDDLFDRAGVPTDVRDRAFADRHRLMERA